MRKILSKVICLLVCLVGLSFLFGLADDIKYFTNATGIPNFLPDPPYVNGSILVQANTNPDGSVNSLSDIHAAIGATIKRDYGTIGISGLSLVTLPDTISVPDAVRYYSECPGVAYAEPDYYVSAHTTPDDPEFWRQWGLSNTGTPFKENTSPGISGADISALSGWNETTGTNGIIIAVLDTGADIGHPDLAGNIWSMSQSGLVLHGLNALEEIAVEPWDDDGHGTHCAGVIGMIGNNNLGGAGVAWNATIMPIKVLDYKGHGRLSDLAFGMAYATLYNASIISCSFGTPYSRTMEDIIRKSPALFVCSAGNYGGDLNMFPQYPACYNFSNVIAVAATDPQDELSWFSNFGNRTVHVGAPGTDIYSTIPSGYSYTSFFEDPTFAKENFTLTGNWTRIPGTMPGEPVSLQAVLSDYPDISTFVIEMNTSVDIPSEENKIPHLIWEVKGDFFGYQIIEYSNDIVNWTSLWDFDTEFHEDHWRQLFIPLNSVYTESGFRTRYTYILFKRDVTSDFSIRNIRIGYRGEAIKPEYQYMSGTSMAAPMVSGMAGLIKGKKPDLTAEGVKQVIMDTADPLPSLQDKTITGARVNLSAALKSLKKSDGIPLYPGWNHVSIPRRLNPGYDTAQIFAGVNSSGHSVLVYVNNTTGYRTLSMNDPVVPLQGYWIYSTNTITVPVRFTDQIIPFSREIPVGWSSIGGWMEKDLSAKETFHTLMNAWSYATGYDAVVQQYEEPIIRGGTGHQSDERPIRPYHGYWLYCSQNGTYQAGFG
ncbi:S8 family serine peptidase [Methanospirillum hungatei]|nr:S8 family serine peptidase [Methanospirillum hungatei]